MKRVKNSKSKWLAAFVACFVCMMLCATLVAGSTAAAPSAAAVRDAYYNHMASLELATPLTFDFPIPAQNNYKHGLISLLFYDLNNDGVEEMILVRSLVPTGANAPLYGIEITVFTFVNNAVSQVGQPVRVYDIGSVETENSLYVFTREAGGIRYLGVETRAACPARTTYGITLYRYQNNAIGAVARLRGERSNATPPVETLSMNDTVIFPSPEGTANSHANINAAFRAAMTQYSITGDTWLSATNSIWAFSEANLRPMSVRENVPANSTVNIAGLTRRANEGRINLLNNNWQAERDTHRNTTTATTTTTTTTVAGDRFNRVDGFALLYEVRNADNTPKNPPRFVWGYEAAHNNRFVFEVFPHNNKFYVQMMNTGVYIAITRGQTQDIFDFTDAIWHGPDGRFGTADDVAVSLRDYAFYRQVTENGQQVWRHVADLVKGWPENMFFPPSSTTTTTTTTTTDCETTTTTSPFHCSSATSLVPPAKTGVSLNMGSVVAIIILGMGGAYCAFRFFKKDKEEALA